MLTGLCPVMGAVVDDMGQRIDHFILEGIAPGSFGGNKLLEVGCLQAM
jgi:hypothetical protein